MRRHSICFIENYEKLLQNHYESPTLIRALLTIIKNHKANNDVTPLKNRVIDHCKNFITW